MLSWIILELSEVLNLLNLLDRIYNAGIVGAGGGGFPTHKKYVSGSEIEYIIINGAECEPLLYCDQILMEERAEELVLGLKYLVELTSAKMGIIALKSKYKDAANKLSHALKAEYKIDLHLLDNYYPAGDEFMLVYEVIKRIIPEGGLPLHVGVVVNNVSTVLNVFDAVSQKPVTERTLTVSGAVATPSTITVPIGVSVGKAIELAGGITIPNFRVLLGGVMMGTVAEDLDCPITKTMGGIIVLPEDHPLVLRKTQTLHTAVRIGRSVCDNCMFCTDICPRNLLGHELYPHNIMRAVAHGNSSSDIITSAFLCSGCGLCSLYACPLKLSPDKVNAFLKESMMSKGLKNPYNNKPLTVRNGYSYRKVPANRVVSRNYISGYNVYAPRKEIEDSFTYVKIPLKQHMGIPALPLVRLGDKVTKGQLLGDVPPEKMGARVHASIDGTVTEVLDYIKIER